jgi:hypothetical protein
MKLLIMLVFTCAGQLPAQDVLTVAVTGFSGRPQLKNEWCWAACIQSLLLTKGVEIGQATIVEAAYGQDLNRPAPGFEGTVDLINGLLLKSGGEEWKVRAEARPKHPDPRWLFSELSNNEPVMIWFRVPNLDHAIVLTGGKYYTDRLGKFIGWRSLTGFDPMFNRVLPIPAANIPRYVYGTFAITLTRVFPR